MIEALINYIAHNPADETSPLFLELNTADMLLAQGGADKVRLYDTNASVGNSPYVKLYDDGKRDNPVVFLGRSYQEKQWVTCECVALGATALSATNRAELLILAIEGYTQKLKSNIAGVSDRLDLGGTSSSEGISHIDIAPVPQQPPVFGKDNEYTATRITRIEVGVFKKRRV